MTFISTGIEPNLIHAVEIVVERVDFASTVYDDTFREAATETVAYGEKVTIDAQVHWGSDSKQSIEKRMKMDEGGDDERTDGWITLLRSQVEELVGGKFKKGDRIVKIDGEDISADPLYIEAETRRGQYTGFKLYKYQFAKRGESHD